MQLIANRQGQRSGYYADDLSAPTAGTAAAVSLHQNQDPAAFSAAPAAGNSVEAVDSGADRDAPTLVFDRPAPPAGARPLDPLSIRALLHPTEHSRLLIALSASAVVFGIAAMIVYAGAG
jgi:hypothetical protein